MTSITDQYRTIVSAAGWLDRSHRGRLRFSGRDAASFLQALVSNDVQRLEAGEGAYATYLTPQGRMIADLELFRRSDGLVASVTAGAGSALAARFDQLVFAEDVQIIDESEQTFELAVVGGSAAARLARALEVDEAALNDLTELAQVDWRSGFVSRSGDSRLPMFKIFGAAADRDAVAANLEAQEIVEVSDALMEALRVEAGRPLFGVDMTAETIPLEAGLLDRGISTTKGCYVGQEIIIRVLHRGGGRVAKRLVTLSFEEGHGEPRAGAVLQHNGREAGTLTSVAHALAGAGWLALGYLARDSAESGNEVLAAGSIPGRVTGLAG